MRRRVSPSVQIEPLDIGIASLLLHGWGSPLRKRGANPLTVYLLSDDDLRMLWRTHRAEVMAEAARLGIVPWVSQFNEQEDL